VEILGDTVSHTSPPVSVQEGTGDPRVAQRGEWPVYLAPILCKSERCARHRICVSPFFDRRTTPAIAPIAPARREI